MNKLFLIFAYMTLQKRLNRK